MSVGVWGGQDKAARREPAPLAGPGAVWHKCWPAGFATITHSVAHWDTTVCTASFYIKICTINDNDDSLSVVSQATFPSVNRNIACECLL